MPFINLDIFYNEVSNARATSVRHRQDFRGLVLTFQTQYAHQVKTKNAINVS